MHDHHLGPDSREDYRLEAEGPVEVFAKHGLRIPVYKLTLAEQEDGGQTTIPMPRTTCSSA